MPLLYAPGQGWQYGSSADVLGAVIEAASGKRFGEFLQEEIFEPLGMKDTAFWVPEEKQDRLAAVYQTEIDQNGQNVLKRYTQDIWSLQTGWKSPLPLSRAVRDLLRRWMII